MSTVLLVEDSLTEIEVISQCLRQAGMQVVSATSGEEAHEKLRFHRPDLIVLDVVLPGQSGFEFCRHLKENTETDSIPIVMCSTKNTNADKVWGTMLGADAYIAKPVNQNQLLETVRKLLADR